MTALFPSGKGGVAEVAYGYKGKGVLIHLLVEAGQAALGTGRGEDRTAGAAAEETAEDRG